MAHRELRDQLFEAGLLIAMGSDGLYGKNATFESVLNAFDQTVLAVGANDGAIALEFTPLLPRATYEATGYLRSFPNLAGPVFSFVGGDREYGELVQRIDDGEPYGDFLQLGDVALAPACCYPIYPSLRGSLKPDGTIIEIRSYCFRNEPSVDPMRMRSFRQREHVRIGTPEQVIEWRKLWLERAPQIFEDVGLTAREDVANDPFFGRAGRLMSMSQREQELKIELLVPVFGDEHPTACSSVNYHQDHFGDLFGIQSSDGTTAHSACVSFGLERCAIALFERHGTDVDRWPTRVRNRLWP
ncbi:MAG: amino acid--[acyl-carrier-protein] ligase [Ilumatobacteraceae bacterium]